ncbi:MAG: MFS transporter [Tepidisphaeraceae bacterium]|jgi:ACS family hexuronate transporter-like MFS transporter
MQFPHADVPLVAQLDPTRQRMTHFRWVILGLLFLGTTVNYVDRLVMGILAPDLQARYQISNDSYGTINAAFTMCYAIGQLLSGRLLDRIGTRIGYGLALASWGISSLAHALARSTLGFGVVRGMLGLSESPNFPASTKSLAEWFPKRERALAFGFINAGSNMGAIIAPAVVPFLATNYGWQWSFVFTGTLDFVVVALWIALYNRPQDHPRVSPAELAVIESDPPEPTMHVPWLRLLAFRQAWSFGIAKFFTDAMWGFYIFWIPKFLHDRHGLDLQHIGLPLITVYVMADVGSICGGWLSSSMIKRGFSVNLSRKTAILISAIGVVPIVFAPNVASVWSAVLILGLATASHQAFSSNIYTTVSDMFPKRAVASVAGLGGTCGYIGATIFQKVIGLSVDKYHNYILPFVCAGLAYIVAFAVIQLLAPRLEPAIVDQN